MAASRVNFNSQMLKELFLNINTSGIVKQFM